MLRDITAGFPLSCVSSMNTQSTIIVIERLFLTKHSVELIWSCLSSTIYGSFNFCTHKFVENLPW